MSELKPVAEQSLQELEPELERELEQELQLDIAQTANAPVLSGGGAPEQYKDSWLSMSVLLSFGLILFIAWAAFFEIDQAVRASGQVISSDRTQIIQAADGGVLAELLVHEGQSVVAGQRLAVLEKERANAAFEETRSRVASLGSALIRARAEALGVAPVFGEQFKDYPDFVAVQRRLYEQGKLSLQDEITTQQISLGMAQEELRMNENLLETGDASRLEVMRARRQVSETEGKISAVRNKYLQQAHQEVTKLEADLDVARHKHTEGISILGHTEITAPLTGVVKYLKLNTQGGVLRPGDELMQISSTESDMVVEVKINPVDIGELTIGLPVSIKLDAFDFSIYGGLQGTLSYISSDTLTEQGDSGRSTTYYRAQITVDKAFKDNESKLKNIALKSGMTSTVDIKTGERTVLHYLIKPLSRAFGGALNER